MLGFTTENYPVTVRDVIPKSTNLIPWELWVKLKTLARNLSLTGIAHGDFKPDNILVDTKNDRLLVIDFQFAYIFDKESALFKQIIKLSRELKKELGS